MAMVQPKSQKLRLLTTHLLLLIFIAAIMFPLLMVIAISLREGNFATGSLIPENISWEHWRLALGFSVEHADGRVTPPPFPVLLWLWNSVKIAGITAIGIVTPFIVDGAFNVWVALGIADAAWIVLATARAAY